jgi:arylsulfatase A-like enzyme
MFYRTDRRIGQWAEELDREVGRGRWVMAVTSDHGVAPIWSYAAEQKLPAAKDPLGNLGQARDRLEAYLRATFSVAPGAPSLVQEFEENQVYLRQDHPALAGASFVSAQDLVRDWLLSQPSVAAAVTRAELLEFRAAAGPLHDMFRRAFHPRRSGDVLFALAPYQHYPGGSSATHGSPWRYDTHVPLVLLGSGIKPGLYHAATSPASIAPTLARVLRIEPPAACEAEPLWPAL